MQIRPVQPADTAEWLRLCGLVEISIQRIAPGCTSGRIGYQEVQRYFRKELG
jgi:hypothetical protein